MNIVYNLQHVGLGNNGGSRTIIKCAETMAELGHEVTLLMSHSGRNKYRWHKISGEVNVAYSANHPKCDVSIATGYSSVNDTASSPAKRKFYYIRGYEIWRASKANLLASYKLLNCVVNSRWLKKMLQKKGIKSHLVYPGVDSDLFYNLDLPRDNAFGAIFSKRHETKKHKHSEKIGLSTGYDLRMLNKHIKSPTPKQQNEWYNKLKVWHSPSELEGLHNPPIEAGLAGCALVCSGHKMAGTQDYAIHNQTAMVYDAGDLDTAASHIQMLMNDEKRRKELNANLVSYLKINIGDRKTNMQKLINIMVQHG